jgi:thiamine-phosphate pyrophosphorylase
MKKPFSVYLISPESEVADEASAVTEIFAQGLETYHVRKPGYTPGEIRSYLASIPAEFHKRIVLHSHFELATEFNLKGVHLNEANKKLFSQFIRHKIISASFHSLEDFAKNSFPYEYVFLSPIFNSISKTGYSSNFDLAILSTELHKFSSITFPKIIALGGIDASNILSVKQSGFSGAALFGAVWQSENSVQAFLEIQTKLHRSI